LNKLNKYLPWRNIFGSPAEDKRKRDVELILRFLALFYNLKNYKKPMKKFLNDFMKLNRKASALKLSEFEKLFKRTADAVIKNLGKKPFHLRAGLNAAVYDSTFTAFAKNLNDIRGGHAQFKSKFEKLTANDGYLKLVSSATTDEDIIPKRIKKAEHFLFG
jgi:hypothetical protein